MSTTHWTPAQEAALNFRGGNLLLSAAAGSGKTAVLVERVIRRLTDETDPVPVDQFLILTFTRAAAAEMRSRISTALSKRLEETAEAYRAAPSPALERRLSYLERQLSLLPSAAISTIDSYCQSLLRQYFYLLDLDPGFRILSDENKTYLLEDDVLSSVLLDRYEKDDPAFLALADLFASRYQDARLRNLVRGLYHFTRSLAFPDDFLQKLAAPYEVKGTELPDDFPWTAPLMADLAARAASWAVKYDRIIALTECEPLLRNAYVEIVSEERLSIQELLRDTSWAAWHRTMQWIEFKKLPPAGQKKALQTESFAAAKKEIQDLRGTVKKEISALRDSFFSVAPERWAKDMAETAPLAGALSSLVLDFSAAYAARKKEEGLLEFNDTEHLVLRLLLAEGSTPERPIPSETALALQKRYREVMVDEYQDTNSLQELITRLISDGHNRFLVGDLKQSIYRFRQADPGIFLEKYETFSAASTVNRRIDLNQNFRSDDAVLSATNFIFRQLLRKSEGVPLELDYGDAEALYTGRKSPDAPAGYVGGETDLLLVTKPGKEDEEETDEAAEKNDLENIELEARLIAKKITALMTGGETLGKDGKYRALHFSDIVILLRGVTGKAPLLLRALRDAGIPAVCGQQEDFFGAPEVEILRAMLSILDNPRQDLPLVCVLRSPFVGLGENALAELRLAGSGPLWDALTRAADLLSPKDAARALRFLSLYRSWRQLARAGGLAPLVETILRDTGALSYWGGLPASAFRLARLRSLYEAARRFDTEGAGGLCRFLAELTDSEKSGKSPRQETAPAAASDAVRIMTIHASKGLEFPVVFLANAAGHFNQEDTKKMAVYEKSMGLGLYHYDARLRCCWPTLYCAAVKKSMLRQSLAEEARLLYVAMTRARDKLIITGTVNNSAGALASWTQGLTGGAEISALPVYKILGARSYLDWIMPAALRSRSLANLWQADGAGIPCYISGNARFHAELIPMASLLTAEETAATSGDENETDTLRDFLDAPASQGADALEEKFRWRYPYAGAAAAPAKLTATAAVKLMEADKEEEMPSEILAEPLREKAPLPPDFAALPDFLAKETAYTGAAYGTLMHKAMELLDLAHLPAEISALRAALSSAAERGALTAEESAALQKHRPLQSLLHFLQSPLGERMRAADRVRKELPFSILLPASDFYPGCGADETIFLQGAIDCLLEKNGRLVIIDYKTDHVASADALREHYHVQLQIYGRAMEKITGLPVDALYLWSFALGEAVEVEKL